MFLRLSIPQSELQGNRDLTPPENLQAKRFRRKVFFALLLAAALILGLFWLAPHAERAIKSWQARRLAHESFSLIERAQWNDAFAKARDALIICPSEPEVWRAVGRIFSRTGRGGDALEWWLKLNNAGQLTSEDRREYATAAISAGEWKIASSQVDYLLGTTPSPPAGDLLLAGQLAVAQRNNPLSLSLAERTMNHLLVKPEQLVAAAGLVFSTTSVNSQSYARAWRRVVHLARNTTAPGSLESLDLLAHHISPRKPFPGTDSLSAHLEGFPLADDTISRNEIAAALAKHPKSGLGEQLLALDIRAQEAPLRIDEIIAEAVKRFGKGDKESLGVLAGWLNAHGRFETTLGLLPLDRALRQANLFLRRLDALAGLGRWNEIAGLLSAERFPLPQFSQHMYLASTRQKLGEAIAARNEWNRALEAANDKEKFSALAAYAEASGAPDIAKAAYSSVIKLAPHDRQAYLGELRVVKSLGETAAAYELATNCVRLWPNDETIRLDKLYLKLLLGASSGEIKETEKEASVAFAQDRSNWTVRATLGLARLRLGQVTPALKAFAGTSPIEPNEISPGALAVRAAVLAANGWKEEAKTDADNLAAAKLLPEERALIAPP